MLRLWIKLTVVLQTDSTVFCYCVCAVFGVLRFLELAKKMRAHVCRFPWKLRINKMAAAEPGIGKQWIPLQRQLVPTTKDAAETYRRNVRRRQKEAIQNALSKGYLITLDRDVILEQWCDGSSNEGLESVLRVSLPNSRVQAIEDMALLSCARLRICNLSNCFVNDMAAFYGCVNLLTLDLSNNQVSDTMYRAQCVYTCT